MSAGKYADAEGLYRRALAISKGARRRSPRRGVNLHNLAPCMRRKQICRRRGALRRRSRSARRRRRRSPRRGVDLNNLANVYQARGKYADAEGSTARARDQEKALGANHLAWR